MIKSLYNYGSEKMVRLKGLIFDVDGTLADTEKNGHLMAFNLAFLELNLNWEWSIDLYAKLLKISGGKERIRYFIEEFQPKIKKSIVVDELIIKLHDTKNRIYRERLSKGLIPLRPGVRRVIRQARKEGLRLAIASTSHLDNVFHLLNSTSGINGKAMFDVIAAGDIVKNKKPAPDIYLHVLSEMKLSSEECLVFEDSDNGWQAARKAGLPAIITPTEFTKNDNFSGASIIVDTLGDKEHPLSIIKDEYDLLSSTQKIGMKSLRNIHVVLINQKKANET